MTGSAPQSGMRILVTRPEPGADKTLAALGKLGLAGQAIPLQSVAAKADIVKAQGASPPGNTAFDALAVTSGNALRHGAGIIAAHAHLPGFAVGVATARLLAAAGVTVKASAGTAAALAPLIAGSGVRHLLYPCGEVRRPELEAVLSAAGVAVTPVEVYATADLPDAAARLDRFLAVEGRALLLFHAPSAAAAFRRLAGPRLTARRAATLTSLCLSQAVADALHPVLMPGALIADTPDEEALLALACIQADADATCGKASAGKA
jgi:uroporphyrinogen-III synthase